MLSILEIRNLVRLYVICVYLPAKMLLKIDILIINLTSMKINFKIFIEEYFHRETTKKMNLFQNENSDSKLHFYSNISDNTNNMVLLYLKYNIHKKDRSKITKIRISTHKLSIETGRKNALSIRMVKI